MQLEAGKRWQGRPGVILSDPKHLPSVLCEHSRTCFLVDLGAVVSTELKLGCACPVTQRVAAGMLLGSRSPQCYSMPTPKLSGSVSVNHVQAVSSLMDEFSDVFSEQFSPVPPKHGDHHWIQTSGPPVKCKEVLP